MGTTTANMGLSVPTLDGDPGVWDTQINASFALLDLHDHTTGKGVKVPTAGLNINANLTFGGYEAKNLSAAHFTPQGSAPDNPALYVKTADLYFKDGNSNEIRLTASGAINIATTGGIAGDYITASASVYYDSAAKTYRFLQTAPLPNVWAYVATGGVDLYEFASGITTRVRLSSPAALAASYECVFPAALPGAGTTKLLQITDAGVMTFSSTVVDATTFTAVPTFSAGATCAANQHFTVSGTGRFKHGAFHIGISPMGGTGASWGPNAGYVLSSGVGTWYVPIPAEVGKLLSSMTFRYYGDGAADLTYELNVYSDSAVKTTLGSGTLTNPAAAWATETPNTAGHVMASGETCILELTSNAANLRVGTIDLGFTHP